MTPLTSRKSSAISLACLGLALLGTVLSGCDKAEPEKPESKSSAVEGLPAEEKAFVAKPLSIADDPADKDSPTTAPVVAQAGMEITVAGRAIPLPAGKLTLSSDGTAVLSADGGAAGNSFVLQMTPSTDGTRPWKQAVWAYQLTNSDDQTTDGLYVGGPEHHLRPLTLRLQIVREPGARRAAITFTGKLVPAEADDPLNAQAFEMSGNLTVPVEGP